MIKAKGYDGRSGLGKDKNGRREPLSVSERPKHLGLGLGPQEFDDPSTSVLPCELVYASNCVETTEDTSSKTDSHKWEYNMI